MLLKRKRYVAGHLRLVSTPISSLDGQNNAPTEQRCVVRFPPSHLRDIAAVMFQLSLNKNNIKPAAASSDFNLFRNYGCTSIKRKNEMCGNRKMSMGGDNH